MEGRKESKSKLTFWLVGLRNPTFLMSDLSSPVIETRTMKRYASPEKFTLAAIVVLATLLRFLYLGRESLWFDESISVAIARLNLRGLWSVVSRSEANMALYYALLHVWLRIGDSEFILRSLSALAGILTVPLIYALGKRMFDARTGLIAAALLAANAFHIQYSQEARAYSLVVLLATLSSLFFVRALEHPSWGNWAGYAAASILTVYAHFFGALVLAAQWASVALLRRTEVPWKKLLASVSTIVLCLLPLGFFALTRDTGQLAWVSPIHFRDIYDLFDALAGGGRLLALAYFLPCAITAVLVVKAWRRHDARSEAWRYAFLLSWLFVPVLIALAVSLHKPVFVDRFLIVCLPALVLLAAVGLSQLPQRWILAGCLAVLLSLSLRRVPWYGAGAKKEDWRGATAYVLSHASQQDALVFFTSYGRLGFDYYSRHANGGCKVAFPATLDPAGSTRVDPQDSLLASLPANYDQVWLLVRFNDLDPTLRQRDRTIETTLAGEYSDEKEQDFHGVRVLEYSKH